MSVSGTDTFRGIEELDQEDLIRFDTPNHSTIASGNNSQEEVDYPINTGDDEVFVVTDVDVTLRTVDEVASGGLDTTADDFYFARYLLSTQPADDLTPDSRLAEDALAVIDDRSYSTTVGHHSHRSHVVQPSFENPAVMPFGSGEYSFINDGISNVSLSGHRLAITGYVMDVPTETMTRLIRQRRS